MTEVNEEIVKQYLELQGYFVMTDVKYLREKKVTRKESSGWGDVDIIATHPDGTNYLIEVKGWHMESFTPSFFCEEPYVDELAKRKARDVLGNKAFKTILVVPEIGSKSRDRVMELAKKEGINEVWEFTDILRFLVNHSELNLNYGSEILQMLRLLKQYFFLPQVIVEARIDDSELSRVVEKFRFKSIYDGKGLDSQRFVCIRKVKGDWKWVELRALNNDAMTQKQQKGTTAEVFIELPRLEQELTRLLT